MMAIRLNDTRVALVDEQDAELLSKYNWVFNKVGYAMGRLCVGRHGRKNGVHRQDKKFVLMHRLILDLTNSKIHADHINGDGLDNRRCNLRQSTPSQNRANMWKPNILSMSKYKGLSYNKTTGRWRSAVYKNGKPIYGGYCKEEIDAATVYNFLAYEHHGEFAKYNLPLEVE